MHREMNMKNITKMLLLAACFYTAPAFAQDKAAGAAPAQAEAPAVAETMPDPTKSPDWPRRIELAKKMSVIQPASQQVEQAAEQLSLSLPPPDRAAFKARITGAIDDKKLEQTSIDAMARTFTVAELQRMVDYFSTPEARSIAQKMPIYQQLVQPEIVRMMDAAQMQSATGAAGEASPAENPAAGTPMPKTAPHTPLH
jgi:hypothetical protein